MMRTTEWAIEQLPREPDQEEATLVRHPDGAIYAVTKQLEMPDHISPQFVEHRRANPWMIEAYVGPGRLGDMEAYPLGTWPSREAAIDALTQSDWGLVTYHALETIMWDAGSGSDGDLALVL